MKQGLAIAYAIKRKNKMAKGGVVYPPEQSLPKNELNHDVIAHPEEVPMLPKGPAKENLPEMMGRSSIAKMILMKKNGYAEGGQVENTPSYMKKAADYELSREANDMEGDPYSMSDGDGSMPYGQEALYENEGNSMEQMRDHLPSDAEHEIEGMGSMRQAMARKGMLTKIMGSVRSKHMGR